MVGCLQSRLSTYLLESFIILSLMQLIRGLGIGRATLWSFRREESIVIMNLVLVTDRPGFASSPTTSRLCVLGQVISPDAQFPHL